MNDELLITADVVFGYVRLDSSWAPGPDGELVGMSRRRVYSRDGALLEVTPWEMTGARIVNLNSEPPKPWWKFW